MPLQDRITGLAADVKGTIFYSPDGIARPAAGTMDVISSQAALL